ncbi:MAG: hypothetical protein COX07_07820 [Bacteroidetes bacterium CG23_combo_of_CG06-09_8_20_14_all_32_9]|nr:MAG: hypothetical protein COX07_07820 [Bacteroidetes bacterium CG23_combo_of_CG06-09_8_20_14_all_32_9]
MKKLIYNLGFLTVAFLLITSCKKSKDPVPIQQQILAYDTSGMTGRLTVYVKYLDTLNHIQNATNTNVYLYASRDDITLDLSGTTYDLAIYRLNTGNGNSAYFGYINYGNYYVLAFNNNINGLSYSKTSIVQVRPQQSEELTITMTENP